MSRPARAARYVFETSIALGLGLGIVGCAAYWVARQALREFISR